MFVPGKPPKHTSRPQTYTKEVSGECRRKENRILGSHKLVGPSTQSTSRTPHVTNLFIILFVFAALLQLTLLLAAVVAVASLALNCYICFCAGAEFILSLCFIVPALNVCLL